MRQTGTWTVVADSSSARIVASGARGMAPHVVKCYEHPASRSATNELAADKRGRTQPRNRHATQGSAMEPQTEPQENEVEKFCRELASDIRIARRRNAYRELNLVAPPEFLGKLRSTLDAATTQCVRASIAKNYTSLADHELTELVRSGLSSGS